MCKKRRKNCKNKEKELIKYIKFTYKGKDIEIKEIAYRENHDRVFDIFISDNIIRITKKPETKIEDVKREILFLNDLSEIKSIDERRNISHKR